MSRTNQPKPGTPEAADLAAARTTHALRTRQLAQEAATLANRADADEELRLLLTYSLTAYLAGGSTLSSGWAHEVLACLRYGGTPNVGHRDYQPYQPAFRPYRLFNQHPDTQVAELALVLWATQRLTELGDLA